MKKELTFSDYIYHLWTRRFFLVGISFLTLIFGYLGMRYLHGELFETSALMLVRTQPRLSNVESEELGIQPPAFQSLFESDETIAYVRNQYNDMYERNVFPPEATHTRLETELERLRDRFSVENGTTVDTTITTQFSPILEFSVLGESRDQALVLMELWTGYCLRNFGNLINDEAEVAIQSYELKNDDLSVKLKNVTESHDNLRHEKQLVDTQIAANYRILTKLPPAQAERYVANDVLPFNMDTGPFQTNVNVLPTEANPEPGIWEQIYIVRSDLAKGSEENNKQALERQLMSLLETSNELQDEILELKKESSRVGSELARHEVELNSLQYSIRLNSAAYAQAQALRRPVPDELTDPEIDLAGNQESFGTLRLITKPILPQKRFSPPRTLVAIFITMGIGLLMLLLFTVECYLRYVIDLQREKEGAQST